MPDAPAARPGFGFEVLAVDAASRARLARLATPHGVIETPAFIFCATKAAMKAATPRQVREAGAAIILANTYHLMLQPGADLVDRLGGLHRMMGWNGPMLTDSGGFQIFSLGHGSVADEIKGRRDRDRPSTLLRITEEGAAFRSYLDGSRHLLTPERSIEIQRKLGADLIVVLDECTPFHADRDYTARSLELTHRWALRSLSAYRKGEEDPRRQGRQALYGIVQGGVHPDLRRMAADFVNGHPFFGHAIGGTLGGSKAQMYEVVGFAAPHLRTDRPIHLLGIGGIRDIWEAVAMGIDTFDCVHPTRVARHGGALVPGGSDSGRDHINLRNAAFREDPRPVDETCACEACRTASRAYLHHLLKAGEILALTLLTIHNIAFMTRMMADIRTALAEGRLQEARRRWLPAG